jgi:hypothetical protein
MKLFCAVVEEQRLIFDLFLKSKKPYGSDPKTAT